MHAMVVQINQDSRSRREAPRVCLVALIAYKRRPFSKAERHVAQQEAVDRRAGCAVAAGRRRLALLVHRQAEIWKTGFAAWVAQARADGWTITAGTPRPGDGQRPPPSPCRRVQASGRRPGHPRRVDMDRRTAGPAGILVATAAYCWSNRRANSSFACQAIPRSPLRRAICRRRCRWHAEPWPRFADIGVTDLRIAGDLATVGSLQVHLDFAPEATASQPAIGLTLEAERVGLPPGPARALGPYIASLAIDGNLSGPVPPGSTVTDQAKAWRGAGGSLDIRHLALTVGIARSHSPRDADAG